MDTLPDETLEPPSADVSSSDLQTGTRLGPGDRYKILQKIGEGGFGTVYMADQTKPVRRRVAIKILKAGMDTRQVIARFEAERQALAMMDHPNIARILDGGETEQGRLYFVMELVRGTPITTFCDEENLNTEQRLHLFIKVCRAVQHAHQKGIIHRDLKPGNILVTIEDGAEAVPKVIDFGVAKAADAQLTDKTLFTRFEQMIGTPAYMSPEQAGARASHDVDTRADIYALGVLLYELLTGTTPIEAETLHNAAFDELRRILREDEAPRPSARLSSLELVRRTTIAKHRATESATLGKQLRGDLDWIIMKAIEKDRRRRYETANDLAADVERHLGDEPVLAAAPTTAYRMGKFARRYKAAIGVAAAMIFLLVAGIVVSTWQAVRATQAEKDARIAEKLATNRLAEMLAERSEKDAALRKIIRTQARAKWVDPVREFREEIASENPEPAVRGLEALFATFDVENDDAPMLRDVTSSLATHYRKGGREDDAAAIEAKALGLVREQSKNEYVSPMTLVTLSQMLFDYNVGSGEEALELGEEALDLQRKMGGPDDGYMLRVIHGVAFIYDHAGLKHEAIELLEEGLPLYRKVLGPESPRTLSAINNLAVFYAQNGREAEALKLFDEVVPLYRKVLGPEHPETLRVMGNLAISYDGAGRKDEALKLFDEVVPLYRKVLGPEHPETLRVMGNLANSYGGAGRKDEALEMREEVLALRRKVLGPEHADTRYARSELADSYEKAGRKDEALELIGFGHVPLEADSPAVKVVLVLPSSEWRWLHPVDGVDPAEASPNFHRSFFRADYDDSGWKKGVDSEEPTGGFGYGDEGFSGVDIGTPSTKALGKSAYFRHRFTTGKKFTKLELRCHRDDGIIVYLDGQEVARFNMREGEDAYRLPADWSVGGTDETTVYRLPLVDFTLPAGEHVLAISLHNHAEPSSDLRIGGITLIEVE